MDEPSLVQTSGRVLILTGPPGAGKSTAARALASNAAQPGGVHVEGDDFFDYIRSGFIEPWRPDSRHQNLTITRSLSAACFAFAAGGYFTVLDWVVGPWFLDVYREDARHTGILLDYMVLRPSEAQASQRARDRAERPIADYGPMRALFQQMSDMGALETHVIDSSHLSASETVLRISDGLRDGRYRLV
jgi:hypothetical protein